MYVSSPRVRLILAITHLPALACGMHAGQPDDLQDKVAACSGLDLLWRISQPAPTWLSCWISFGIFTFVVTAAFRSYFLSFESFRTRTIYIPRDAPWKPTHGDLQTVHGCESLRAWLGNSVLSDINEITMNHKNQACWLDTLRSVRTDTQIDQWMSTFVLVISIGLIAFCSIIFLLNDQLLSYTWQQHSGKRSLIHITKHSCKKLFCHYDKRNPL